MSSPAAKWAGGKGPRILLGTYALDQHEVGAIAVAHLLRNAGAEVVYLGRFGLAKTIVAAAVQEDVDIIGMSCHSWEYIQCTQELLELLDTTGIDTPVILGGSVITDADARTLIAEGVAAVFGAGSTPSGIIEGIQAIVSSRGNGPGQMSGRRRRLRRTGPARPQSPKTAVG